MTDRSWIGRVLLPRGPVAGTRIGKAAMGVVVSPRREPR